MIVVQARAGSSRFPGKVLAPFGRSTLLGHILERLARVRQAEGLWVATSTAAHDDGVAAVAEMHGLPPFRGSEEDVLGRFVACLETVDPRPELVVRICADRPLICPSLIDDLLDAYDDCGSPDYLSNSLRRSWPEGLDVEIIRTAALIEAAATTSDAYDREHVTPHFYRNPGRYSVVGLDCPYGNFSAVRATIDTEEDRRTLTDVDAALFALDPEYDHRAILNLAAVSPELFLSAS